MMDCVGGYGCTNILYLEYDINANTDDGTCETYSIPGCTDPTALNFNEINAEWLSNNPSFTEFLLLIMMMEHIPYIEGCSDSSYLNLILKLLDIIPVHIENSDDPCISNIMYCWKHRIYVLGDPYDVSINFDDGHVKLYNLWQDEDFVEYNDSVNVSDPQTCINFHQLGCTNEIADNYDSLATMDDGSCLIIIPGCTDELYTEYNPNADQDDGSCLTLINEGINACNDPAYAQYYSYEISPSGLFIIGF